MNILVLSLVLVAHDAQITAATVYPDRARVTRTVAMELPAGKSTIRFDGLPLVAESGSLRAKAGDAVVKSIRVEAQLHEVDGDKLTRVRAEIAELERSVAAINHEESVLAHRRKLLGRIWEDAQDAIDRDIDVDGVARRAQWAGALEFATRERLAIDEDLRTLRQDSARVEAELQRARERRDKLHAPPTGERYRVFVEVESSTSGTATVSLSYVVHDAKWEAAYDVYLDDTRDQVRLDSFGTIRQATGEAWENIEITLSTARPDESAIPPVLEGVRLVAMQLEGRPDIKMVSVMEDPELDPLKPPRFDAEPTPTIELVGDEESRPLVSFPLTGRYTIPADERPHRVPTGSWSLSTTRTWQGVPKLSPWVFEHAHATSASDRPLLRGSVRIFRKSGYVGLSEIPAVAPRQPFTLSLGPVEALRVRRTPLEVSEGRSEIQRRYNIDVFNHGADEIEVTIVEHVPVSERDDVFVSLRGTKTPTRQTKDGLVYWDVTLRPHSQVRIPFGFEVDYPKHVSVDGLEE